MAGPATQPITIRFLWVVAALAWPALAQAWESSPRMPDRNASPRKYAPVRIGLVGKAWMSYGTLGLATQTASPALVTYEGGGALRLHLLDRFMLGIGTEYRIQQQLTLPTSEFGNRGGTRIATIIPEFGLHLFGILFLSEWILAGTYKLGGQTASGDAVSYSQGVGYRFSAHYPLNTWISVGAGAEWTRYSLETIGATPVSLSQPLTSFQVGAMLTIHFFDLSFGDGGSSGPRASPVRMRR